MPKCVVTSSIAAEPSTSHEPSARDTNAPRASLASAGRSPTIAVEQIGDGDQALDGAVLVHHERDVLVRAAERFEQLDRRHRVGHEQRFARQRCADRSRTPLNASGSRSAERTMPSTSSRPPWQTTNWVCACEARNSRSSSSRGVDVDPFDVGTRRHDRRDALIAELEHALDDVLFGGADRAGLRALADQRLDLVFGEVRLGLALDAEHPHAPGWSTPVSDVDDRAADRATAASSAAPPTTRSLRDC